MPRDHEVFLYRCPNCYTVIAPSRNLRELPASDQENFCPACDQHGRFEAVYILAARSNSKHHMFMVKKDGD